ncbi:DUF3060 domain-containing protein [Mycobacterium sp. E787]|uniref:DUF3060 domain-containing protein n=1 Tax=Mycobacterium sp. E787 TaxID=1834150 RepID=UPI0007FBEE3E|nr:DUF3060 domain-containing protein [Mycobacterium sp. E787]OBI51482.1 hypothetical protein A5705_08300 [Mycobacterium sp. E787]
MDSDDPEKRIRELERRLADASAGPPESVPAGDEPGSQYDLLRRRRFGTIWLIALAPFALLFAILVLHPYRAERHPAPATSSAAAEPTADLSGALTVVPGGNLTEEPSHARFTVVCDRAELTIAGNANAAYVAGHCSQLIVRGSHNKVVADNADAIDTDGSGNRVVYRAGTPRISIRGTDNVVTPG